MNLKIGFAALATTWAGAAFGAEPIKLGFITTLSGPLGVTGEEAKNGFELYLKEADGKLGGRDVEFIVEDDQAKPDIGRQAADKLVLSEKVDVVSGVIFSNVLLAAIKPILDSGAFYLSNNAGPSQIAGRLCSPNFFGVSHQNDTTMEGLGIYMQQQGIRNVYLMAPNYPAGKDMIAGFKRRYKGAIAAEVYTQFGQLDYSAEIAQIRAAKPGAVMFFYPGGMGINFVKQYNQAGMKDVAPLYTGSHVVDQTILGAVGDAAIGVKAGAIWNEFLDNAPNRKFVTAYEAAYDRLPSPYAALAYDTAHILDEALTSIDGRIEDKAAFRKAMETVSLQSVRGNFRFNTNHFPVMDYYMTEIRKDDKGRLVNGLLGTVATNLSDAYVDQCRMAAQ